jgi:hypothetical protein
MESTSSTWAQFSEIDSANDEADDEGFVWPEPSMDAPDPFERMMVSGSDWAEPGACWLKASGEPDMPGELMEALVARAVGAIEQLQGIAAGALDPSTTEVWAQGIERLRRQIDAAGVEVADHVDRERPFRKQGFLTTKAWLKHRLQLSGIEAHRRLRVARMLRTSPIWKNAHDAGLVGVAQCELMSAVIENSRIELTVWQTHSCDLLIDAMDESYDEFERRVRRWEMLADPAGAAEQADRNRMNRDAEIRPRPDGSWALTASFDDMSGAEFSEIFGHYVQAEWDTDWAEARERVGDKATMFDLRRTQSQRRADALLAMARAAASAPPWSKRPVPTVNLLIDQATYESTVTGQRIDPSRYRDAISRTQACQELHPIDVVKASIIGHVRRVVYDGAGVVIDLGRKQRLFSGASREAVMLLAVVCSWTGCDMRAEWCEADHTVGWKGGGNTDSDNGGPLCPRHNVMKEQGFRIWRDPDGDWHTFDPEGNEIL